MRPYLGPPRELVVRRMEGPHHRAMRILWAAATIVMGVAGLAFAATGLGMPRENQGFGPRLARMIVVGASVAIGVLEFRPSAKGKFLLTLALAWTAVMALVVLW